MRLRTGLGLPSEPSPIYIKMPKKDGLETLKELKKIKPSAKVIIATGYKSVDTAQEAIRLGASDYVVKPFDRKTIAEVVKKNS